MSASSSRDLETLAPESSSPFASEPAISERVPRGRRSRHRSEGGDTIPAPVFDDDSLGESPLGSSPRVASPLDETE